jgi:hypothetical protein
MRYFGHWLLALPLFTLGCNHDQPPVTSPSGEQAGYAERYPARLQAIRARFADDESTARTTLSDFKGYPDALRNPDYRQVRTVVDKADATGRSSAYTEAALEAENVQRFFDEEKDGLHQKVGGAVSYASTSQQKCSEDMGGVAVGAMDRAVEKQLEERLRAHSDVHRYIEDHQEELGKANVDTLNKQADKIARTSNVAYVRLELHRREVEALLADSSTVESTLDKTIKESDAVIADPNAPKTKKALAEKRRTAAQNARNALGAEVEQDRRAVDEMKQRITSLQNDYKTALTALEDDLERRAEKK